MGFEHCQGVYNELMYYQWMNNGRVLYDLFGIFAEVWKGQISRSTVSANMFYTLEA